MSYEVLLGEEKVELGELFEFEKPKYQIEDAVYLH